jgi:hypothetical protein
MLHLALAPRTCCNNKELDMSNDTMDILVAIDTDTILNSVGKSFNGKVFTLSNDSTKPSQLYSYADNFGRLDQSVVYMIAPRNSVIGNSQGGSELNVQMNLGDSIRWRATSLSKGLDHAVVLYQYTQTDGNGRIGHLDQNGPEPSPVYGSPLPIINFDNYSSTPKKQDVENYFWQGEAQIKGNIRYSWAFMIVDSQNKVLGYCSWDPYITIN